MIKEYFLKTFHHWRILLRDKTYFWSLVIGFLVFFGSIAVNISASVYHDQHSYPSVGDLILDRIPTVDMSFMFIWGFFVLIFLIMLYSIFFEPEKFPFSLKTFGLLILIRACFLLLTNVGPPIGIFHEQWDVGGNIIQDVIFKNDLFFSGHTAVPFMAYLVFRRNRWFCVVMFVGFLLMAATVLLMHMHYSIDVFAAPFITYGIYAFSQKIFRNLNMRFEKRIALFGWKSLQNRIKNLRFKKLFIKFKK